MANRIFTLEEADNLIPWLESKFQDLSAAREEEGRLQMSTTTLMRQSRSNGGSGMEGEIVSAQKAVDEATARTSGLIKEITDQGILIRNVDIGLVDFLSVRGGREVFLCWIRGEAAISYWHSTREGYGSRKPL